MNIVDRYQDWQDEEGQRDEDFQQSSQIAQEEVGVQATLGDEVRIRRFEHRDQPLPQALGRGFCSFSLGDQKGSRSTRTV